MINGDPYSIDDRTEIDKELQKELLKDRINDIYRSSISGKLDIFLKYGDYLEKDVLLELKKKFTNTSKITKPLKELKKWELIFQNQFNVF